MTSWYQGLPEHLWLEPFDSGKKEAEFLQKSLRLEQNKTLLDAPCGSGRIAVPIARNGIQVTCLDVHPGFIRQTKKSFKQFELQGRFLCSDMREMQFHNEFDAAINWGGSFGYFSDEKNLDVLNRYARALKKGGRFILEQANREFLVRSQTSTNQKNVTWEWNKESERLFLNWSSKKNEKSEHYEMSVRLYTKNQLVDLFEKVGLSVLACYGSTAGEIYKKTSKYLIILGVK